MKRRLIEMMIGISLVLITGCSSPKVLIEKIDSSNKQAEAKTMEYSNYWEAMENLDLDYIKKNKVSDEYVQFANALNYVVSCNLDSAELILKDICQTTKDTLLLSHSNSIYNSLLFTQSKWAELSKIEADSADVYKILSQAYSSCDEEQIIFPKQPTVLYVEFNRAGTPVVTVEINGHLRKFLFDTGAGLTVISSDVANECGVFPVKSEQAYAKSSNSKKIGIQPTVIGQLRLGDLLIKNHPAMIIDAKKLEIKLLGIRFIKIDGIIGWNAIQNFKVMIDYKNELLTLEKPGINFNENRNFFWLGYPIVKLMGQDGTPLLFGFDSGANQTSFSLNLLKKINVNNSKESTQKTWGVGGFEKNQVIAIPELSLILDNYKLNFKKRKTASATDFVFLKKDGILGSDISDKSLTIDYQNGVFKINKQE